MFVSRRPHALVVEWGCAENMRRSWINRPEVIVVSALVAWFAAAAAYAALFEY
ncbi:MAG: hypothetical protein AVDCRST_MAG21-620 [uncultured Nocardioidaceae bacterium]|uniref:Uncharacterized protein n=1 Tax=uncultured Nocardioidaceae bacterium TaxID=253824 RepID=A0A6J4MYA2_9ACTN|nr:MAG: hypothetical protein AVDCRST_MAG21-620 [uncultured Nocardioidaceae bacterium]